MLISVRPIESGGIVEVEAPAVLSNPRFKGLRDQLNNAAGLRRSLDETTANDAANA